MPQDVERYLYFTVALLKDSVALDALWQDALNYHMIDQPGKLIAMRLTEYYELKAGGALPPTTSMPTTSPPASNGMALEQASIGRPPVADDMDDIHNNHNGNNYYATANENLLITTSPDVAQNAEAAAEYWTIL